MEGFAPEDLAVVFSMLQDAGWDAILVGGQAVNVWAYRYERDVIEWRQLRPFSSRDLDYHGGLTEARLAMRVLKAEGRLNTGYDPSPNAGVLQLSMPDGRELVVDILTGVYGLSAAELSRTAVELAGSGPLEGITLRVIHPLLLLEAKAASLRGLSQLDRQDEKHLRIMVLVTRSWLMEQLDEPRAVYRATERLAACAASPDGLHAHVRGIDLLESIPLEQMRASGRFLKFFDKRLPQILSNIEERRSRHAQALEGLDP